MNIEDRIRKKIKDLRETGVKLTLKQISTLSGVPYDSLWRFTARKNYRLSAIDAEKIQIAISKFRPSLPRKLDHAKVRTTRTYRIWKGVVSRGIGLTCHEHYFENGIKVCDRWLDYENFLEDMGEVPDGLSLDRINVFGDYEPLNCRWASARVQGNNKRNSRRYEYKGMSLPLSTIVEITGFPITTLAGRLASGKTVEEAISKPFKKKPKKAHNTPILDRMEQALVSKKTKRDSNTIYLGREEHTMYISYLKEHKPDPHVMNEKRFKGLKVTKYALNSYLSVI